MGSLAQISLAVHLSKISFQIIQMLFTGGACQELFQFSRFFCPCRSMPVQSSSYHMLGALRYLALSLAVSRDDFSHACSSYSSVWKSDYSPAGFWKDKWKVFLSCGFLNGHRSCATSWSSWDTLESRTSKSLRTSGS